MGSTTDEFGHSKPVSSVINNYMYGCVFTRTQKYFGDTVICVKLFKMQTVFG